MALQTSHAGELAPRRPLAAVRTFTTRLGLRTRIVLASTLLAVLVAGAFAVLIVALSNLRTTTREANQSKDLTSATLVLERNVLELETNLRGYLNTSDRRFLRAWRDARSNLPAGANAVERSASGDEARERRARTLVTAVRQYVLDYAVPLIGIAQLNPRVARSSVALSEGRLRLEDIRRQFSRLLTAENDVSATRVSSATSQSNRAIILGLAALAASVALVILFGAELARAVAHPVRRASDAAKDVAGGDLTVRVPERGPAELHELSVAFNEMAASLERSKLALEAQNQQLRESERLRSELISVISHEVRTPLASLLGYTSLLQERPLDEETRKRFLAVISAEARRLESLVDELVDVKRIEEGRLELNEESFDLAALLAEQVHSFSGRSERHPIELDVSELLTVRADRNRLAQVIANLLANAIKYSPHGGPIEASASRRDGSVRVSVHDRGIGIAPEHRARMFTKFFRAGAKGRGIGGMGLGLAVSREIVEAHGGRMGFQSELGKGSTFWFELPADELETGSQ